MSGHTLGVSGSGYSEVLGPDGERVYTHRLVAVAHGLLDGLDDPRDVHHERHPWINAPDALAARGAWRHRCAHLGVEPGGSA